MSTTTNSILMIRPAHFGFNAQTAGNNAFQSNDKGESAKEIAKKGQIEFDAMVEILRSKGIHIIVIEDTDSPSKPDAIFPNNWISFHTNGAVLTYPMFAPNRRIERREDIIEKVGEIFDVKRRYTFEHYEEEEMYLEGTGSMLFDRDHKIVYACLSQRTDARLLDKFCVLVEYRREVFHAVDRNGLPIYHTNVMMALGEDFAVLCKASIQDKDELKALSKVLENTGKEIIDISYDQMAAFAGNMLQVRNNEGKTYLVMSQTAYDSLNQDQIETLSGKTEILPIDISTIEYYGGGSVRCMMAEIFLPSK
ncbi:MAG: arginine deiminase-related protein [Saprospiraceae bacterium]|nr:arginine deiminase-related protein [Saprospiraceae bacterium]